MRRRELSLIAFGFVFVIVLALTFFSQGQNLGYVTDEHGCMLSFGYSWCDSAQRCTQAWDECAPTTTIQDGGSVSTQQAAAELAASYVAGIEDLEGIKGAAARDVEVVEVIPQKCPGCFQVGVRYSPDPEEVNPTSDHFEGMMVSIHGWEVVDAVKVDALNLGVGDVFIPEPDRDLTLPQPVPVPVYPDEDCVTYSRNGEKIEVCATCGDGLCEEFEECVASVESCQPGENGGPEICMATADCGGLYCPQDCEKPAINSFKECVEAGNPVMESYPRKCRTKEGMTFVEEIEVPIGRFGGTPVTSPPSVDCPADEKECPGDLSVSRDPYNNCEFKPCPTLAEDGMPSYLDDLSL